jgi:hypothetical protein
MNRYHLAIHFSIALYNPSVPLIILPPLSPMKSPLLLDLSRAHHRLISLVRESLGGSSGTPKRFSDSCCINKQSDQFPIQRT